MGIIGCLDLNTGLEKIGEYVSKSLRHYGLGILPVVPYKGK